MSLSRKISFDPFYVSLETLQLLSEIFPSKKLETKNFKGDRLK